jgi:hypothetical protein
MASRQPSWQAPDLRVPHGAFDTEGFTGRQALMIPALLAGIMLVVGFTAARASGVDWTGLSVPYLTAIFVITILSVMVYVFITAARLARRLADNPVSLIWEEVRAKTPMLLLPMLIFPLFLIGFTAAKTAIPFLVGYHWDAIWAETDKLVFGDDAWRIAHRLLGTRFQAIWEALYSVIWAGTLLIYKANVAIYARPRRVGVIYSAMLLTWLVGGWFLAYSLAATGPIFVHLVDPSLADRFAPLRSTIDATLSADSSTRLTQAYLAQAINLPVAVKGGGISAMPSMHIAAVSIYVLSARGTKWLAPAIAFWIMIFLGSAYFGYHYWVDGIAAAAIAWACWTFAEACFRERPAEADAYAVSGT